MPDGPTVDEQGDAATEDVSLNLAGAAEEVPVREPDSREAAATKRAAPWPSEEKQSVHAAHRPAKTRQKLDGGGIAISGARHNSAKQVVHYHHAGKGAITNHQTERGHTAVARSGRA